MLEPGAEGGAAAGAGKPRDAGVVQLGRAGVLGAAPLAQLVRASLVTSGPGGGRRIGRRVRAAPRAERAAPSWGVGNGQARAARRGLPYRHPGNR
jgi:hypothetical protein